VPLQAERTSPPKGGGGDSLLVSRTLLAKWALVGFGNRFLSGQMLGRDLRLALLTARPRASFLAGCVGVDETNSGGRQEGRRVPDAARKRPAHGAAPVGWTLRSVVVPRARSRTYWLLIPQAMVQRGCDPYQALSSDIRVPWPDARRAWVTGGQRTPVDVRHRQVAPHQLQGYLRVADFKFNVR
jgi:hypothetical protein